MSLPRKLSELRFASLVSIMVTVFVVLVIVIEACMDHGSSSSVSAGFQAGKEKKQLSAAGIFSSLPLVIFSYMYQINVPSLYQELEVKSLWNAKLIGGLATVMAAVAYILAGIFGYLSFAENSTVD